MLKRISNEFKGGHDSGECRQQGECNFRMSVDKYTILVDNYIIPI